MRTINFKDLKKELKDIEKISKENLDVKTGKSDLELWIKHEHIEDSKIIFYACVLISIGETRKVIQELMDNNDKDNDSDDCDYDDDVDDNYKDIDDKDEDDDRRS